MKILFLTFYFEPDLSAGSFRSSSLINELKKHDLQVTLITTEPNRYSSFHKQTQPLEKNGNIKIIRIKVPKHNSGMFSQALCFASFYIQAMKIASTEKFDGIFATSSRLFTAFLGARIAKKNGVPLYLDVRDLFIDTLSNILNPIFFYVLKPFLLLIEKYTFGYAKQINIVSNGFKNYFEQNYDVSNLTYYTNGIDPIFLNKKIKQNNYSDIKEILYAGNIGSGQGLEKIIPQLAKKLCDYKFKIIGDGGKKQALIEKTKNLDNVQILSPVDRETLLEHYSNTSILFLHLNDLKAFKKVLPSKLFEYAATGKPIISGISGYSKQFQEKYIENSANFYPGDCNGAIQAINQIELKDYPRQNFINKFNRINISKEFAKKIIEKLSK